MCGVKALSALYATAVVLAHLFPCPAAGARTPSSLSRQKRISDQRLAELETLIALSKMKNKIVTIPVGFGRVDPLKVGRRKRSAGDLMGKLPSGTKTSAATSEEAEAEGETAGAEEETRPDRFYRDGGEPEVGPAPFANRARLPE